MTFAEKVMAEKTKNPKYQIRYLAFTVEHGGKAFAGSVIQRNMAFMSWISDRVCDYEIAHPDRVNSKLVGQAAILNHNDFTDFIVSGAWRKDA